MRIGLIGESPFDTYAIINLLSKKYPHTYKVVLERIKGYHLDNKKNCNNIVISLKKDPYDLVIFIRDLDSDEGDSEAKKKKMDWFNYLSSQSKIPSIFLLNIYELEALMLADIDNFNALFNSKINFTGDPSMKKDPKEFLMTKTKKGKREYKESDTEEIFKKLDIDKIKSKCKYFKIFIDEFEEKTKISKPKTKK